MGSEFDDRVEIGRVDLRVSDLDRALVFYQDLLGFSVVLRADETAVLSADRRHQHVRLRSGNSAPGDDRPSSSSGRAADGFAVRYPDRAALGRVLRRLEAANVTIEAATDTGDAEALRVRDPDGNSVDLYWERPFEEWLAEGDAVLAPKSDALDLERIRAEGTDRAASSPSTPPPMSDEVRRKLREVRARLLHLHKVLLEDARTTYELDRGRVGSAGNLLQLVINDSWFAWLHTLSELIVRIDQAVENDSPAVDTDGVALADEVGRLLTASEDGDAFSRRYFDALQRQPAVVLAHADVRQALKAMKP